MSIKVNLLTKIYNEQKAVDAVTFEANKGDIVGFLGPNGAGKSTTMKILTGFIPATSGSASVCGYDVTTQTMDAKRCIGYLPEHNPLYTDMYVKEYLNFIAGIHQVNNKTSRIAEMIDITGLGPEQKKRIGQLSKGYRQRVGLAAALIHNPEVLILDEPTTGLDPNQIIEIRNVVKNSGKDKTIIFSTHIMQEVAAICNQVIIINKGKIVVNDAMQNLQKSQSNSFTVLVSFDKDVSAADFKSMQHVIAAENIAANNLRIKANTDIRNLILAFAVKNNLSIQSLVEEQYSLEDIFRKATQN